MEIRGKEQNAGQDWHDDDLGDNIGEGGLGREGALPYKAILGRVAAGCYNALD